MANLMIKVMHPTNNSTVDVEIPDDMTLHEVVEELASEGFIANEGKGNIGAVLKDGPEAISLDMNKTLAENGAMNNSTIRLVNSTQA